MAATLDATAATDIRARGRSGDAAAAEVAKDLDAVLFEVLVRIVDKEVTIVC